MDVRDTNEEDKFLDEVIPYIIRRYPNIETIAIAIPTNQAFLNLYEQYGVTNFHDLFQTKQSIVDVIKDCIHAMIFYDEQTQTIDGLEIERVENVNLDNITTLKVNYVWGLPLFGNTIDYLENPERLPLGTTGKELAQMGKDAFYAMIKAGKIRGKDLVSLCLTEKSASKYCDIHGKQRLFIEILWEEFGYTYDKDVSQLKPLEMYREMTDKRMELYFDDQDRFRGVKTIYFSKELQNGNTTGRKVSFPLPKDPNFGSPYYYLVYPKNNQKAMDVILYIVGGDPRQNEHVSFANVLPNLIRDKRAYNQLIKNIKIMFAGLNARSDQIMEFTIRNQGGPTTFQVIKFSLRYPM